LCHATARLFRPNAQSESNETPTRVAGLAGDERAYSRRAICYYLIVGNTGGRSDTRPYVRPPNYHHNGIHRRYHARRIHRAAQRPIKPASWNLGFQHDHAMLGDGAIGAIDRTGYHHHGRRLTSGHGKTIVGHSKLHTSAEERRQKISPGRGDRGLRTGGEVGCRGMPSRPIHVDGGFAVGASSFNRQGLPRSLSCATAWSATARRYQLLSLEHKDYKTTVVESDLA
jgi:hypothetical protein